MWHNRYSFVELSHGILKWPYFWTPFKEREKKTFSLCFVQITRDVHFLKWHFWSLIVIQSTLICLKFGPVHIYILWYHSYSLLSQTHNGYKNDCFFLLSYPAFFIPIHFFFPSFPSPPFWEKEGQSKGEAM